MGRAKAWLPWFGQTMIEHVVGELAAAVDEIVVVTSEALELPSLPARIVRDRDPARGPLAGIRDGLAAIDSEFAFVTSTDAPYLTRSFVSHMLELGKPCAPVTDGHVQVLCAVYPSTAWKQAERLLESGVGRPLRLLEFLGFETAQIEYDESFPAWRGFNTPEAYLECVVALDPTATCEVELLGRAALEVEQVSRRVPVGTLGEVLSCWPESLGLVDKGRVCSAYRASLAGGELVRDLNVPIGPDERVRLLDSSAEPGNPIAI